MSTDTTPENHDPAPLLGLGSSEGLGPLPPHRKVTAFGRVWIEEDLLAYGRQERAAERALWQEMAATHVAPERERHACSADAGVAGLTLELSR